MLASVSKKFMSVLFPTRVKKVDIENLNDQNLSRFSQEDIILETVDQIQDLLPDVLGQALARTWVDKRFLSAFQEFPLQVLEKGGVYLPDHITIEFSKEKKSRPKVIVYENMRNTKKKLLELKLIMVAEE